MNALCLLAFVLADAPAPAELATYVTKPDAAYAWKHVETSDGITKISLTSQKWQGEDWQHDVVIYTPKDSKPAKTMLLYNTGGSASGAMNAIGMALAQKVQAPVCFLFGIPKQPLYGKKEDALIAETFVKYLETQDASWPLLFPMVKSVVRCMDCVQEYTKNAVTGFVVTGASKRGWTTYLTAATGDTRVKAIAPMVFDMLNMKEQLPHQVKSFGGYSLMIHDYSDRKLLPMPDTAAAKKLWAMVDPWVYRDKLTMPKLIILGTNDPYWSQDSLNLYWNDLKGPKSVLYVPNAGHDLRPIKDPAAAKPEKDPLPMKAFDTLAAFTRYVSADREFPNFTVDATGNSITPTNMTQWSKAYRNWSATSETNDFRKSIWKCSETINVQKRIHTIRVEDNTTPQAIFLEMDIVDEGGKFHLSTPLLIVEKK